MTKNRPERSPQQSTANSERGTHTGPRTTAPRLHCLDSSFWGLGPNKTQLQLQKRGFKVLGQNKSSSPKGKISHLINFTSHSQFLYLNPTEITSS